MNHSMRNTTDSPPFELSVLEGVQKGSKQGLSAAKVFTVGNAFNNDIFLNDACRIENKLEIILGNSSAVITLMAGDAIVDDRALVLNEKTKVPFGTPVRIQECLFTITPAGADLSNYDVKPQSKISTLGGQGVQSLSQNINHFLSGQFNRKNTGRDKLIYAVLALGVLGSVLGAANVSSKSTDSEFEGLTHSDSANSPPEKNAADSAKDLLKIAEIEGSVREVFRTHGVLANIESSEVGYVIAKTHTADLAALESSKNAAERDVFGLSELIVLNEPPVVKVNKPIEMTPGPVAAMKFELVVVGNPSYVVTSDAVRYLVGARFPSGHQLKSIHRDKIVVEKNGEVYEWVN